MKAFWTRIFVIGLFSSSLHAHTIKGQQIMISAPSQYAVDIGKNTFEKGGNVVDVAVAVGLTLSVTSPYFAALGGGGFAMIKIGRNKTKALDFREVAPAKAHKNLYVEAKEGASKTGGLAVGVPGFPYGLWELHRKYGKLPWKDLFDGAIDLAENGFRVSGEWVDYTEQTKKRFNHSGRQTFYQGLKPGQILKQAKLAKALRLFRDQNLKGFYEGPVAKDLVESVKASGGILSLDDLKNYQVKWRKPHTTFYKKHRIDIMPLPSSGSVVIDSALQMMDIHKVDKMTPHSVQELHYISEILARAFRGRSSLGDPDFSDSPVKKLVAKKYVQDMAKSIDPNQVISLEPLANDAQTESKDTTHYSIMDGKGNAVSLTVTLNGRYGSAVVTEQYGIALNNEMDDFTTIPGKANQFGLIQGRQNYVEAGKRPLSSMSPTIVSKNNRAVMAIGAPGGPTIISGVFQVLHRVLANQMDLDQAVQSARVHHQFLPKITMHDDWRLQDATLKSLTSKGHKLKPIPYVSKIKAVYRDKKGTLHGSVDSRGEGAVGGY